MKYSLSMFLLLMICSTCKAQELIMIRDTTNHFEIGVPAGWKYGVPANKVLAFVAYRQKQNDQDVPKENYNINIFDDVNDYNQSYKNFIEAIGEVEGFKIIRQGEKTIKNRKYNYVIETHKNTYSKWDMINYVLFTNNNGEVLILTMVTTSENFETYRKVFDAIAESLKY